MQRCRMRAPRARIIRVHDPKIAAAAVKTVTAMLSWRIPPFPKHNLE